LPARKLEISLISAFLAVFWLVSPARAQSADDLFGSQTLQRLDWWVNSADWAKLGAEFQANTYYPADVIWNGASSKKKPRSSRSNHEEREVFL
jgi:hypothetical protein